MKSSPASAKSPTIAQPVFNQHEFSYKSDILKYLFCFGHLVQKLLKILKVVQLILIVVQTSAQLA